MAILGPVLLAALGILVTYIVKLNEDQYMEMEAFRYALKQAHDHNKVVGYGTWVDINRADVGNPIIGSRVMSSGSGHVHWAITNVTGCGQDPLGKLFVKINLMEYDMLGAQSGAIKPTYFTSTFEKVTVNKADNATSSNRSSGYAEGMLYQVEGRYIPQAWGHGRSRGLSGTTGE